MDLAALVQRLNAAAPDCARVTLRGDGTARVVDLTEDSRTALPGSLFVARAGLETDGRRYIDGAIEAGAAAVLTDAEGAERVPGQVPALVSPDPARAAAWLAEMFHREPSSALRVVGVTGTNGKSTVAGLVHQILNDARVRCGLVGTVEIDDGREVAPADMTTPPAIELSRSLGTMVDAGCRAAAIEVSSHALDQGRADAITHAVALFTNLSPEHLDYHGTMAAYGEAKAHLLNLLADDGVAVLNADDPWARSLAGRRSPTHVRLCSAEGDADASWRIKLADASLAGSTARLQTPLGEIERETRLAGAHNAMNLAQALAAADVVLEREGLSGADRLHALTDALPKLRPPAGRLQRIDCTHGPQVFIDYAHTDDALERTLRTVRDLLPSGARLWVVFGAGGERDATKRPRMGAAAGELADRVVVTSDNPRREPPSAIIDEILAGIPEARRDDVLVHADRGVAIDEAIGSAEPADVVVIAGKGHEREQVLADGAGGARAMPFDDTERAIAALRARGADV